MKDIKSVLILYVGGTIGMKRNENNHLAPVAGALVEDLKRHHDLHNRNIALDMDLAPDQFVLDRDDYTNVVYTVIEYPELLDSSNVAQEEWIQMVEDIQMYYESYDGFVILHGTDTLAYTSSALSFMLRNLSKPVILTGSQIPIFEANTDAIRNIYFSVVFASLPYFQEVCVFFYDKLMRGNRVRKYDSGSENAFRTPNFHQLAVVHISNSRRVDLRNIPYSISASVLLSNSNIDQSKKHSPMVQFNLESNIALIRFTPQTSSITIERALASPIKGAVLETFGTGDIPSRDQSIIHALQAAIMRDVKIINVTQCFRGFVTTEYEAAEGLTRIGVIPGYDMTSEAACAKLAVFLKQPNANEFLRQNVNGEMTIPNR